ncbi:MAG: hypothetical protein ABL926_00295 [Novosphingobium sp.]|uniref:hypothetical protein n=1 Tax=Novosphingobium sp. TaxID=1874826 RepID=UPI0032B72859
MNPGFVQLAARAPEPLVRTPFDRWLSLDGEAATLFFREPGGFLLRFLDQADFRITLDPPTVSCTPFPGTSDETLADLHFNQVLPLILAHRGQTVLHASAVAVEGQGIGFIGATGRGKSTLAGAFARAGYPFLTDDGLIVRPATQGYAIEPRRPILRLRSDSEAEMRSLAPPGDAGDDLTKRRMGASLDLPFCQDAVPLKAIYVLTESRSPECPIIAPLASAVAVAELMQHSFILDVEDHGRVSGLFGALADLAERVPCFTLDYRRDYAMLQDVIAAVLDATPTGEK